MQQVMRGWTHMLSLVAGIAAPVGFTFWVTSDAGARSNAHYAEVNEESMNPKEVVLAFEKLAFEDRRPEDAIRRYFSSDAIDRDPNISSYRSSLIGSEQRDVPTSKSQRKIEHIAADGEIVMVHYRHAGVPETEGVAVVDIFRVAKGKIVAHWDVRQDVAENSRNPAGAF